MFWYQIELLWVLSLLLCESKVGDSPIHSLPYVRLLFNRVIKAHILFSGGLHQRSRTFLLVVCSAILLLVQVEVQLALWRSLSLLLGTFVSLCFRIDSLVKFRPKCTLFVHVESHDFLVVKLLLQSLNIEVIEAIIFVHILVQRMIFIFDGDVFFSRTKRSWDVVDLLRDATKVGVALRSSQS